MKYFQYLFLCIVVASLLWKQHPKRGNIDIAIIIVAAKHEAEIMAYIFVVWNSQIPHNKNGIAASIIIKAVDRI